MTTTATLKKKLTTKKAPANEIDWSKGLSTGQTPLNLACSGRTNVGLLPGHVYLLVGDSMAGKSFLAHTIMAEASINPHYNNYRLILDNPERGALMDYSKFFGKKMASRIEPPSSKGNSKTSEQFYDNVESAAADGRPFIYVLDSEDALRPESEIKKAAANRRARKKIADGEEAKTKGSYGTEKAKINSSGLRGAHNCLEATESILIVIKQSRMNIGFDAVFNPKTRNGGLALTFFAAVEMWFSIREKLRRTVRGKNRVIGSKLRVHVKKNRIQGRDRAVDLMFYPSVGFCDIGSCISFLVDEKHWEESKGIIAATEFDFSGSHEKLVQKIEEDDKRKELKLLASEVWNDIEDQCDVKRKNPYF